MLDEAITEITGSEGLAAAGGHLNESARAGCGEGLLQAFDGAGLSRPKIALVERGKMLEAGRRAAGPDCRLPQDPLGAGAAALIKQHWAAGEDWRAYG